MSKKFTIHHSRRIRQTVKQFSCCLVALTLSLCCSTSSAYEVWMGTHLMQASVAANLDDWALTASMVEGVIINRAPHDTNPSSNNDWRTILRQINNTGNTIAPFPRSQVTRNTALVDELAFGAIESELQRVINLGNNFGYDVEQLMVHDTNVGGNPYNWTEIEVQHMREWLDNNGHEDILLIWNARNFSQANQNWAANPLIDHVLIEGSANDFLINSNNKITLLNWLWTNPATVNKDVILMIPRSENSMTQYAATRRVAVKLGQDLGYGEDGIRSDRLVFMPVTYNDNVPYLPETSSDGAAYENTMTSLVLSLLEQRPMFEGLDGTPTNADADSFVRQLSPPPGYGTAIAGWDTWDSGSASDASVTLAGVTGSAVTTSEGAAWHTTDERGASADGDWGTLAGPPAADTSVAETDNQNLELPNATTGDTITFTITNNGSSDLELTGFHFDAYAFRPKAARAYELSVSSGDITNGVIYTSADDEITSVGGTNNNLAHDDISHSLVDLSDSILEVGGSVSFLLAFSSGDGDGSGGHDLWIDNVAVSAIVDAILGDFDGDGDVDLDDLDQYNGNVGVAATGELEPLDLNNDGTVGADDFAQHYETLVETSNGAKGTLAGDLDLDGTVDVLGDAFALIGNLNNPATSWSQGDVDGNGFVNVLGDAFALIGNLGKTNE